MGLIGCQRSETRPQVEPAASEPAASVPAEASDSISVHAYDCEDGFQFTARVADDTTWVFLPDTTIALPHVVAASGARFSDGRMTYWSKGDEALLETGTESHTSCRNNRGRAAREVARLSGVDFRAVGQEPGWLLDVDDGERIVLLAAYGSERYVFPASAPEVDRAAATTTYRAAAGGHELVVLIEERLCHDGMSGEPYESTVSVRLDGEELRGCGRALN